MALARHLEHAQLRDRQDLVLGAVDGHLLAEPVEDLLPVLGVLHVDGVDHDEAAEVAEADLARGLGHGLEVGRGDVVLAVVLAAAVAAGVDVDRGQRLGLVDDNLAAARERDAAREQLLDLALDVVALEDGDGVLVERDARAGARRDVDHRLLDGGEVGGVVDQDAVDLLGEEVAHGALDQPGLLVKQHGAVRGRVDLLDDGLPAAQQHVQVADEPARLLALARRADDHAHPLGDGEVAQDVLEALALARVLDLAGDAAGAAEGHEHQEAPGQGDVGGRAGSLGADLVLDDLDDDLGADGEELRDVLGLVAGLALLLLGRLVVADELDLRVVRRGEHVPVMEEGVLRLADVDEGRLEAALEVLDAALEDGADHPVLVAVLELEALEDAVVQQRDALLERLAVDHQLAVGLAVLGEVLHDPLQERELLAATGGLGGELRRVDGVGRRGLGGLVVVVFVFG